MYTGLLHTHHWMRYLALFLIVVSIVKAISSLKHKGESVKSIKSELNTMIIFHVQLLTGLILFFVSPKVQSAMGDMGSAMKDSASRLLLIEHPLVMIIALILVTIGYLKLKKITDRAQYGKTVLIYYGIALVLVLSRIPSYSWSY